ncbi:MAG: hypothetical protein JSS68_14935 [Actinobacteria bacterium]|nr:hypothetical protein [Actinomycetota bacterium]
MAANFDFLRNSIQAEMDKLDEERERLTKALSELGGSDGSKPRGRRKAKAASATAPTKRKSGGRRRIARKGQRQGEVIEAIKAEPGITASQVAKKIGAAPSQVHAITKVLLAEAKPVIKKDGPKYMAA